MSNKINKQKTLPNPGHQGDRIYNVYIDEAGQTPYYNDKDQRVLTLAGVITDKDETKFDSHTRQLLAKYKLPQDTEIHINELFAGKAPFDELDRNARQELVYGFLKEGLDYTAYVHPVSPLKPYVKPHVRIGLEERNLDLYLYTLYHFTVELDLYFFRYNEGKYRLIFDDHSDFHKRTKKMIEDLCKESGSFYSLKRILGPPEKLDSKCSRFIQLSDAICYIYTRHRQFEVKTLKKPANLMKYEDFYRKCYLLFKDKVLPFHKLINFKDEFLDGIFSKSKAIFDFKEFKTRDFNHMGNWLTKKRKPDVFDPTVNTYWESGYLKMKELSKKLEKKLSDPEDIFNRRKAMNPTVGKAVTAEIINRFRNKMKNVNRDNKGWEQESPEAKRGLDFLEDFSKKMTENNSPPKTDLKSQRLIEEIADQIELENESKRIHDASELELLIKGSKVYFNKITLTMYLYRKISYEHANNMVNAHTDNNDSQSTWKRFDIFAEYLKSYTEAINTLDQDIFEAYEKTIKTLQIMMKKISLFHCIQSGKQQAFRADLFDLNMVLFDGISQYKGILKGLKHFMNILEEAHHAFNAAGNLLKKVVKLRFYTKKLINILNTNKTSDSSEKSIEGIPGNKQKIVPIKVKMRIPGSRKKKKGTKRKYKR